MTSYDYCKSLCLETLLSSYEYEYILFFNVPEVDLSGMIVVQDTTLGQALGGTRIFSYKNIKEELFDTMRLATAMTLKNIWADIPFGGGKASINLPKGLEKQIEKFKTHALLKAYTSEINKLGGKFITGEDMGMATEDIKVMRRFTNYAVGIGDPSELTAYGVDQGIKACVEYVWPERKSLPEERVYENITFGIQGLGHTGLKILQRVKKKGGNALVACDIDSTRAKSYEGLVKKIVPPERFYYQKDIDIFCPCAKGDVLDEEAISQIANSNCRIIAGSANTPVIASETNLLYNEELVYTLFKKGIVLAPCFIINGGGVRRVAAEYLRSESEWYGQYNEGWVKKETGHIYDLMHNLLQLSEKQNLPQYVIAEKIGKEKLKTIQYSS